MTFIHAYLLGGLILVGAPVLVHLLMRQKPRTLSFPAFRFLRRRHVTNRRRLRLQHLLLLLLRMLVVAVLCLALARPRAFSERLALGTDRPVSAVFVLDSSPSMGYASGEGTLFDDARRRAREIVAGLAPESRVALTDTREGAEVSWLPSLSLALPRLDALQPRPGSGSLNRAVGAACDLLAQAPAGPDDPPRLLYVFSDRASSSWDPAQEVRVPDGVHVLFVDLGKEKPQDLAIDNVEVVPPVVAPGGKVQVHVTVRSTGGEHESDLVCELGNDDAPAKRAVTLGPGRAAVYTFERTAPALAEGDPRTQVPVQVTARLATNDALPVNNAGHATFLVRSSRKVLTVAARPEDARIWRIALEAAGNFSCAVKTPREFAALSEDDLAGYKVVCVFQAASLEDELWDRLKEFVLRGGGLALVPPGEEMTGEDREEFNRDLAARELAPASLEGLTGRLDRAIPWAPFHNRHRLTQPFYDWARNADPDFTQEDLRPAVRRYWKVKPAGTVIAGYANGDPALVERLAGKGKVLLFTTPLDARRLDPKQEASPRWHTYWDYSSFGLVLADQACRYLAGDLSVPEVNVWCGQAVRLSVPRPGPEPPYFLEGPGLTTAETNLPAPDDRGTVEVPQAVQPGNYLARPKGGPAVAGFSLRIRPEENRLEKVPAEVIEKALGEGSLVPLEQTASLEEVLSRLRPPPVELLPYLMLFFLLVLTVEGFFANRFYRRSADAEGEPEA